MKTPGDVARRATMSEAEELGLVGLAQAAALPNVGVSRRLVRAWALDRRIRVWRVGSGAGTYKVHPADVLKYASNAREMGVS